MTRASRIPIALLVLAVLTAVTVPLAIERSHKTSTRAATKSAAVYETKGHPVTGSTGVSRTNQAITAATKPAGSSVRVHAMRRLAIATSPKPHANKAWANTVSRSVNAATASGAAAAQVSPKVAQTIGTNFLGAQFIDDSNAVPPDAMGAVGPTQFFVAVNGRVRTFDKSGAADGALNTTLDNFFAPLGGNTNGTSDPRVRYDRISGRWFLSAIDTPTTGANHFLLAVSSGPTITPSSTWSFFSIAADSNRFLDFDTLGIDEDALYLGANIFDATSGDFVNVNAYVVRKSSVLGAGPIVFTKFANLDDDTNQVGPFAPMGVDNLDTGTNTGYIIGVDSYVSDQLDLRRISNPGGTPSISSTIVIPTAPTTLPAPVSQPSPGPALDASDLPRLSNAVVRNGRLWTSHNFEMNASGAALTGGGREGVRWYELSNLGATPSVRQSGTVFDSSATAPLSYWMPSVMVSGQGHAALGFSRAGTDAVNGFAGAATAGRLASDVLGAVGAPAHLQDSTFLYDPAGDTATPRRWGDFSYTSLDPTDDMTMWTVQEYTSATNKWGVRVAKLIAPAPTFGSGGSVVSGATGTTVAVNGTGFYEPGAGFAKHLTAAVGGGVVVNNVLSVTPTQIVLNVTTVGATLGGQTVTITNPDGQSATGTISVTGPATPCGLCNDFNADTKPDILWHNAATGSVIAWFMNGTQYVSGAPFSGRSSAPIGWRPVATGDFNADGKPDILWHNASTGQVVVWFMNGTQYISGALPSGKSSEPVGWKPVAAADFNADGKTDILWHNASTGQLLVWLMNDTQYVSETATSVRSSAPVGWVPFAAADFDADTKPDILWHNAATGQVVVWLMDGISYVSGALTSVRSSAPVGWKPVAAADFSGDTKPDILWHNAGTGQVVVWLMNGTQYVSGSLTTGRSSAPLGWIPLG